MAQAEVEAWRRIGSVGVDFGKTIGLYDVEAPFALAEEMMKHMVSKFGQSMVYIVSKAGPDIEARILAWLGARDFCASTGLRPENIIFVRTYEEKRVVVERLGLEMFIDDHIKVIRDVSLASCVKRVLWFGARPYDIRHIPCSSRNKVAIVQGWGRVGKTLSKIPRADVN